MIVLYILRHPHASLQSLPLLIAQFSITAAFALEALLASKDDLDDANPLRHHLWHLVQSCLAEDVATIGWLHTMAPRWLMGRIYVSEAGSS